MKQLNEKTFLIFFLSFFVFSCGIDEEIHQKTLKDLRNSQKQISSLKESEQELEKQNSSLRHKNDSLQKEIEELKKKLTSLNQDFIDAMKLNDMMSEELEERGASIENLKEEKNRMDTQRQKLLEEHEKLLEERESLKEELIRLRRMKKAADRRNAEYRDLMKKLKKMIDAGTLSVKIRNGRMIVSLSSDVLFPSGRTKMKEAGKEAIIQLSETLNDMEDRHFLVVGHTDDDPIKTKRFPSNWELSAQRAIEVVKMMIESGVSPDILTAAGHSFFDPLVKNDSSENKEKNRRVEIIFMPRIEELPGFDDMISESEDNNEPSIEDVSGSVDDMSDNVSDVEENQVDEEGE
ncbi:MAG: OmpA family protein [bacterium]